MAELRSCFSRLHQEQAAENAEGMVYLRAVLQAWTEFGMKQKLYGKAHELFQQAFVQKAS